MRYFVTGVTYLSIAAVFLLWIGLLLTIFVGFFGLIGYFALLGAMTIIPVLEVDLFYGKVAGVLVGLIIFLQVLFKRIRLVYFSKHSEQKTNIVERENNQHEKR